MWTTQTTHIWQYSCFSVSSIYSLYVDVVVVLLGEFSIASQESRGAFMGMSVQCVWEMWSRAHMKQAPAKQFAFMSLAQLQFALHTTHVVCKFSSARLKLNCRLCSVLIHQV